MTKSVTDRYTVNANRENGKPKSVTHHPDFEESQVSMGKQGGN